MTFDKHRRSLHDDLNDFERLNGAGNMKGANAAMAKVVRSVVAMLDTVAPAAGGQEKAGGGVPDPERHALHPYGAKPADRSLHAPKEATSPSTEGQPAMLMEQAFAPTAPTALTAPKEAASGEPEPDGDASGDASGEPAPPAAPVEDPAPEQASEPQEAAATSLPPADEAPVAAEAPEEDTADGQTVPEGAPRSRRNKKGG